jgi:hypothetical protein
MAGLTFETMGCLPSDSGQGTGDSTEARRQGEALQALPLGFLSATAIPPFADFGDTMYPQSPFVDVDFFSHGNKLTGYWVNCLVKKRIRQASQVTL